MMLGKYWYRVYYMSYNRTRRHIQTRARHNDRAYHLGLNILGIHIHILDLLFAPLP
jgi:hypothetical protein